MRRNCAILAVLCVRCSALLSPVAGMAPAVSIESTEHLDRLVRDSAKLVIHCFTTGEDDNSSGDGFARVVQAFDELSNTLDASSDLKSYRVDASSRPDVAAGLLLPAAEGEEARDEDGGDGVSAARWVFFNAGKMVSLLYHNQGLLLVFADRLVRDRSS